VAPSNDVMIRSSSIIHESATLHAFKAQIGIITPSSTIIQGDIVSKKPTKHKTKLEKLHLFFNDSCFGVSVSILLHDLASIIDISAVSRYS